MKNYGLQKLKVSTVDNFTSETGIKLRRLINKPLRKILKLATKRKIIIDYYPTLEKNTPYIFASTHSFDEDIIAGLSTIDRNAYVLIGTTDQIDYNPQMYAAYINGMVYVDRLDEKSRKDSVDKMEKILKSGSSILIFPEGGWNNTENLLCQKLFAGPYILAQRTGVKVVPICTYNEAGKDEIYIKVGQPIDMCDKEKKESLIELRDCLSTMMYESIEQYSTPIKRAELSGDIHEKHMEERKNEYMRVKWSKDVWDEELTVYQDKSISSAQQIRESLKNVELTVNNAKVIAPALIKRLEDEKYDFKKYMKKNWRK